MATGSFATNGSSAASGTTGGATGATGAITGATGAITGATGETPAEETDPILQSDPPPEGVLGESLNRRRTCCAGYISRREGLPSRSRSKSATCCLSA
jgi:hypothetical protein